MNFLRGWWRSMGPWRWLNVLPIVIALYLSLQYEAMGSRWVNQGVRELGGREVQVHTRGAIRAGEWLPLRITVSEPMELSFGLDGRGWQTIGAGEIQQDLQVETRLRMPPSRRDGAILVIANGQHDARWRLGRLIL